jgi:hypothetical protein
MYFAPTNAMGKPTVYGADGPTIHVVYTPPPAKPQPGSAKARPPPRESGVVSLAARRDGRSSQLGGTGASAPTQAENDKTGSDRSIRRPNLAHDDPHWRSDRESLVAEGLVRSVAEPATALVATRWRVAT